MKKIFTSILLFLSLTVLTFGSVYASWVNSINNSNVKSNWQIETKWIKSFIVKKSIKAIASALRNYSDDSIRKLAEIATSNKSTINNIIKNKNTLANKLDNIADKYDYATTSIRQWIYDALVWYLWHDIAWVLSNLLDLALL